MDTNSSSTNAPPVVKQIERSGKMFTNEDIIAELCVEAEAVSIDIRDCLRLYKELLTTTQLTALFSQLNKETIIGALNFLGAVPSAKRNWGDYLKPTVVRELIVRIQNLLIDKCGFCNEHYASRRSDKCYLKCCSCGQFVHQICLERILGDKFNVDLSENDITKVIFPYNLNTYYFCHECSRKIIPQETAGLKKAANKSSSGKCQNDLPPVASGNTASKDVPPPEKHMPGDVQNQINVDNKQHNEERIKVCHFYSKGICKHGKVGQDCKFKHPPYCKKFLAYGPKSRSGCDKGQDCELFHPKMCKRSVEHHVCYNAKCTYFHVKGTRRVPPRFKRNQISKQYSDDHYPNDKNVNGVDSNNTVKSIVNNHFLDLLQQMKVDILQTIDHRFSLLNKPTNHLRPPENGEFQNHPPVLPQQTFLYQNQWMPQNADFQMQG